MLSAQTPRILECHSTPQSKVTLSQLHSPEAPNVTQTTEVVHEERNEAGVQAGVGSGPVSVKAGLGSSSERSYREAVTQESRRHKIEFLLQHIMDYQSFIREIAEISGGDSFLFLDDLYHIRKEDQPQVLDYFHRIAKGNKLWLKVGTIRHRTEWYKHSNPPIGMKLGDDAEEIDLDLTLEKYSLTRDFLMTILEKIAIDAKFNQVKELLLPSAVDRLVLASGGVAHDFLAIFRSSIDGARERWRMDRLEDNRILVQDVNQSAGDYDRAKRDEFNMDTLEEREKVQGAFDNIRTFCLEESKSNCFVLEKDRADETAELIEELVDLRLLHLVQSRVTIANRPGKLYIAYMLDLGQYTGERLRRGIDLIPIWKSGAREQLRRSSLIYDEDRSRGKPVIEKVSESAIEKVPTDGVSDTRLDKWTSTSTHE